MTREEAIEYIKSRCIGSATERDGTQWSDAMWTAIEALQDLSKPNNTCEVDLISRQDALKPFCTAPDGTRIPEVDCDNFPVEFSVEFIKKHLLSLPSAPDSRQRGEWVRKYDGNINCYWYECDQCGEYRPKNQFGYEYSANFCPNCGARMKGADDE